MRLTKEELLNKLPYKDTRENIVEIMYGDVPHLIYNEKEHQKFLKLEDTLSNISAVDNYIYVTNGTYSDYRTLIGNIKINSMREVLCGDIKVKYYGKTYDIYLTNMYNRQILEIFRFGTNVVGWCNKDSSGSLSSKKSTKELDLDTIRKILNIDLSDYGRSVQLFMETCKEIYKKDKTNYILQQDK